MQVEHCLSRQRGEVSLLNLNVLNAILCVTEHGCKRRGLPKRFNIRQTIFTRRSRWSKMGIPDWVFANLHHARFMGVTIERVDLDGAAVMVHPHGAKA